MRRRLLYLFLVALAAGLLALPRAGWAEVRGAYLLAQAEQGIIPNVIGQPLPAAEAMIRARGLRSRVTGYRDTGDRNLDNRVAFQSPSAGRVQPGYEMILTLYRFAPALEGRATVPMVQNNYAEEAHRTLRNQGFGFNVTGFASTNNQALHGRVASQSPGANTLASRGTVVNLTLYWIPGTQSLVHDVRHQTPDVAGALLSREGLRYRVVGSVPAGPVAPGQFGVPGRVAAQSPAPNSRVSPGTTVDLTLFAQAAPPPGPPPGPPAAPPTPPRPPGPPPVAQVVVPNVVGQPVPQASGTLRGAGLNSRVVGSVATQDRAAQGLVASQSPPAGSRIPRGSSVALRAYCADVIVPGVVRQTMAEAQSALGRAGLQGRPAPGTVTTRDRNLEGRVGRQAPETGACVSRGSAVQLYPYRYAAVMPPMPRLPSPPRPPVARPTPPRPPAPGQAVVPNVVGQPAPQALGILANARLKGQFVGSVPPPDPASAGKVAGQSPVAGAHVPRESSVGLRVYCAAAVVPRAVGEHLSQAQAAIGQAGLQVQVAQTVETPNRRLSGLVASQSLAPGACVARGTRVQLTTYRFAQMRMPPMPRPPSLMPPGPPPVRPPVAQPPGQQVTVPNVVGRTAAEGSNVVRPLGLGFQVVGQVPTNNPALANRIASQTPPAGARVNRGTAVQVRLHQLGAAPPPVGQVVVPNVVGRTAAEGSNVVRPLGLGFQVVGQVPTNNPALANRIASQTPPAGARVNRGAAVQVRLHQLGAAPPPVGQVVVPNVVGRTAAEGSNVVRPLGLGFQVVGQVPTNNPALANRIASQMPPAGARVNRGTPVQARVHAFAAGTPPRPPVMPPAAQVAVPNVVNAPLGLALQALARAGLSGHQAGQVYTTDRFREGRVADQSPAPGARVGRGTPVSVRTYRVQPGLPPTPVMPVPVVVPSVVGMSVDDAVLALARAGLSGAPVGPAGAGRVASQTPAGGTRVNRGAVVHLRTN